MSKPVSFSEFWETIADQFPDREDETAFPRDLDGREDGSDFGDCQPIMSRYKNLIGRPRQIASAAVDELEAQLKKKFRGTPEESYFWDYVARRKRRMGNSRGEIAALKKAIKCGRRGLGNVYRAAHRLDDLGKRDAITANLPGATQ